MIHEHFQVVLNRATEYTQVTSDAMRDRDAALRRARDGLRDVLPSMAPNLATTLNVKEGGRQANYSPVAWIRIYSPDHAPTAHDGYYLVYLFAADGSRLYLSLQQGTSEFRANAMRPIRDPARLRRRAAEGRQIVDDVARPPIGPRVCLQVDLAATAVEGVVGAESQLRIQNYEDISSWAWRYAPDDLKSDDAVVEDLATALPLLAAVYREPIPPGGSQDRPPAPGPTQRAPFGRMGSASGQGLEQSADVRLAVEKHAEILATADLEAAEWVVEPVGHLHLGYDLRCRRGADELHVEVKGTRSTGEEVKLTGNEVRHARYGCSANHALFVASHIQVGPYPQHQCSGGWTNWHRPWSPDDDDLTVTEYRYRLPDGGAGRP